MKYLKHTLVFLVIGLVIIFCGTTFLHNTVRPSPEIKSLMDKKIDDFHLKLTQNKFAEIYNESDSGLKTKFTEQQFIDYLQKAKDKFGTEIPKANVNSQENLINTIRRKMGKVVTHLQSNTISEKPNYRSEIFVWAIYNNDEIKLLTYEVFSNN